ncbi:hypothetical protein L596_014234 [Steinernema carpocapsae]|uniref:Uncharacterized protein n=1 Tax=Steinernema carpocapsae TaxID=34508 RepID=A0A4V6A2P4_STECR|nr:hypothetical protein L596_014234 [Steinernema carpocapsae]
MFFRRLAFVAFFAVCLASKDLKKHCKVYDGASFNEMFVRCVIENQRFEEIKEKCGEVLDRKGRCEVPLEPVKAGFVKDSDVYFVAEEENGCLENPEAKDFEVFVENEDAKECGRVVAKAVVVTAPFSRPMNYALLRTSSFVNAEPRFPQETRCSSSSCCFNCSSSGARNYKSACHHETIERRRHTASRGDAGSRVRPALTTVAVPTTTTKGTVEIGLSFSLVLGTCLALI